MNLNINPNLFRPNAVRFWLTVLMITCALLGCSEQNMEGGSHPKQNLANGTSLPKVSYYAAARFLEQASWGPTPESIAEVQRLGFSAWIDKQIAMRPFQINAPDFLYNFSDNDINAVNLAFKWLGRYREEMPLIAQDQLRVRVAWALFNFIPVGGGFQAYGYSTYQNLLLAHALGNYGQLLIGVTRNTVMAEFLDNKNNRYGSPNENYARELMQLFSLGLIRLNIDGSSQRDSRGQSLETYSQKEVVSLTAALSGWCHANLNNNLTRFGLPMRACNNGPRGHDDRAKELFGQKIPAGLDSVQELEIVASILMGHPNIAPFVSRRLIQSLTTSQPSPAYIKRIAEQFVSSKGDLSVVVKSILLDPEARAGDDPSSPPLPQFGRIKEPNLHHRNVLRGLGCKTLPRIKLTPSSTVAGKTDFFEGPQFMFNAPNVFGYVSPDHRAPQSQINAPEQALLTSKELQRRFWNPIDEYKLTVSSEPVMYQDAGCEIDLFVNAAKRSDAALLNLASERFFRGAMPQSLRYQALKMLGSDLASVEPSRKFIQIMTFLWSSPAFGVVK